MKCIFTFLCLFAFVMLFSQQSLNIGEADNYYAASDKAETYFAANGTASGTGHKQYMRWQGHMEYRAGVDGEVRNFAALNYRAYQSLMAHQQTLRATHGEWEDLGPSDYFVSDSYSGGGIGRINCIAFHPSDANTIWVGAAVGGLWKTSDGGTTWSPRTDAFASIAISGIAIDHTDPNIIYVLTGDGDGNDATSIGVIKTTNGGFTWQQTNLTFGVNQNIRGYKLLIHPTNPLILLAATTAGIYRTTDGGSVWTNVYPNVRTTDLEFSPADPNVMYGSTMNQIDSAWWQARLVKSLNNGVSWFIESDPNFPDTSLRCAVAVSPSETANVYVLFGGANAVAGTYRGVYKSTNFGATFSTQSTTPNILNNSSNGGGLSDQASYDLVIAVDPLDDEIVYVGGINMWKSINSGVGWSRATWWRRDDPTPYVHADWHSLEFNGSTLFAGVDGGIYKTTDGAGSWTELSAGLSIMQFYQIDVYNNTYVGGSQDNGTNGAAVTNSQTHNIHGGDGFGCTWHSGNDQIQYLSAQNNIVRRQFGSNIIIWQESNGFWYTDIKMHTTNTNFLFLNKGKHLFRGNEISVTNYNWDSLGTGATLIGGNGSNSLNRILGYAQGTDNPEVMYVVNRGRIIKTTNLSNASPTWDTLVNPVIGIAPLSDVIIDPVNSQRVWLTCGGYVAGQKVFFSWNGGGSWINISGTLPNVPVRCITYHQGTNDDIYLGMEVGTFFRDAAHSDWLYYSNYLPNTIISDLVVSGGYVYAGTFGRGIWRSSTYSVCPVDLVLTPANDGNPLVTGKQVHHASNSITTTRIHNGGLGTEVYYNSGNYVDMTTGFWAKQDNFMEVRVEGCPN